MHQFNIFFLFSVNLCSLSVGLHFGWTSPSIPKLTAEDTLIKNLSLATITWIASIQSIGDLIGAPLAGYLCQTIGRKKTILLTTIPHFISWILIAIASTSTELLIARFIAGLAEGGCYISVPMYIGEIAEPEIRGIIGSGISLSIIFGIFFINILGNLLSVQVTAMICSIIPILTLVFFSWMPESPYYLAEIKEDEQARESLRTLRDSFDVEDEFHSISATTAAQMANPCTFKEIFTIDHNRKAFVLAAAGRFFQQMSGLTAITYYLMTIFNDGGSNIPPLIEIIAFSCTQIVSGILCVGLVDNFGRVPLLVFSAAGGAVSLLGISSYFYLRDNLIVDFDGFNWIPFVGVLIYQALFGVGYVMLPTVLISELFASNIKTRAYVLIHFVFALTVFVTGKMFLLLQVHFGTYLPFAIFAGMAWLGALFAYFILPETKGKTLEEIQKILAK